jgi:hypothetical protein
LAQVLHRWFHQLQPPLVPSFLRELDSKQNKIVQRSKL